MILKTLPLGVRMVVDEETLSAVTSAPELSHKKTRGFKGMIPEWIFQFHSGIGF
jgi:hypothetical protein